MSQRGPAEQLFHFTLRNVSHGSTEGRKKKMKETWQAKKKKKQIVSHGVNEGENYYEVEDG